MKYLKRFNESVNATLDPNNKLEIEEIIGNLEDITLEMTEELNLMCSVRYINTPDSSYISDRTPHIKLDIEQNGIHTFKLSPLVKETIMRIVKYTEMINLSNKILVYINGETYPERMSFGGLYDGDGGNKSGW